MADILPGARRQLRPHREVPFLLADGPFPQPKHFNLNEKQDPLLPPWYSTVFAPESFSLMQHLSSTGQIFNQGEVPARHTPALYSMPTGEGQLENPYAATEYQIARVKGLPGPWDLNTSSDEDTQERNNEFSKSAWQNMIPMYQVVTDQKLLEIAKENLENSQRGVNYASSASTTEIDAKLLPSSLFINASTRLFKDYEFDRRDFVTFPSRKGWNQRAMQSGLSEDYVLFFRQKDPLEAAALIQSWLYFGMLNEVLGPKVNFSDFVAEIGWGRRVLTLRPLLDQNLVAMRQEELESLSALERDGAMKRILICYAESSRFARAEDQGVLDFVPFAADLGFAVRILGSMLEDILGRSASVLDSSHWGIGAVIKHRILTSPFESAEPNSNMLCVNDIARLTDYARPAALYYLSNMQFSSIFETVPNSRFYNHSACNEESCKEYNVDKATYVPKHRPGCGGQCQLVGPSVDVLHSLLEHDPPILPMVKITSKATGGDTVRIDVDIVPYTNGMIFTAISHVWSDGMGNVKSNELPTCLTTWIHNLVRSAHQYKTPYVHDSTPTGEPHPQTDYFWMDTFCVPRARNKARDNALSILRRPFDLATYVLVIHSTFGGLSSDLRSYEECVAWVLTSPWSKRLWTFQEAAVASKLLIQFRDGAVDVQSLLDGIAFKFSCYPVSEATSIQLSRALRQMLKVRTSDKFERNIAVWNSCVGRSASVEGDDAICIADLMDIDVARICTTPCAERAEVVYESLPGFPQQILFSGKPKLDKIGFRWADAKLAASYITEPLTVVLQDVSHGDAVLQHTWPPPSKLGNELIAAYPGFQVIEIDFPKDTFFFFDAMKKRWIKATGGVNFPDRKTREPRGIALIMENDSWMLQERKIRPKPAVLVTIDKSNMLRGPNFKSLTFGATSPEQTRGREVMPVVYVERYVELSIVPENDPELLRFRITQRFPSSAHHLMAIRTDMIWRIG